MDVDPDGNPSMSLYYTGRELLETGDARGVVVHLKQSWSMAPHAHTAYQLAKAFKSLDSMEESHQWSELAYQLNPNNNQIATSHANALSEQGRVHEAIKVLCLVLDLTPRYGPAKKLLSALRS